MAKLPFPGARSPRCLGRDVPRDKVSCATRCRAAASSQTKNGTRRCPSCRGAAVPAGLPAPPGCGDAAGAPGSVRPPRGLSPTPTPAEPPGKARWKQAGPSRSPSPAPARRPALRAAPPDASVPDPRPGPAQPSPAGSAARVNPEECGGRNVHADEMDANLMLMSGGRGRPGLSRAPRALTAAVLRRQP